MLITGEAYVQRRVTTKLNEVTPATRRAIWWLAGLGFLARTGTRLWSGAADFAAGGYTLLFDLARSVAAGHGLTLDGVTPTVFRPPLYPLFLAGVAFGGESLRDAFVPVLLAQALLGAGTVWCAALLALEMSGEAAAVIAAGITAFYPYYLIHDTALQDTSLFTLLTAIAVILLGRARRSGSGLTALGAGLALGAGVLTRASLAPFAVAAPVLLAWLGPGAWRTRSRAAALCLAAVALTVSPWLVRSWRLTGVPVLTTETGLSLWTGNNPLTFSHYPRESSDLSKAAALDAMTPAERRELDRSGDNEAAVDAWFWRQGSSYICSHPVLAFTNGFRKVGAAFGWLPSPRRGFWTDLVYAVSYAPVMLLGICGMCLRRKRLLDDSFILLGFVCFVAVTALFFGHTSHRAYLDLYWIVFAAGLWAEPASARAAEPQLLFLCARAEPPDASEIRALVQQGLAWDVLIDAAEYHNLAPCLHVSLERACPDLVPATVAASFREAYRDSARRNLVLTVRLSELLDAFAAEGLPVVPLKGPVLAESLYSDPVLRPFSDLDLLVRKQDVPAAIRLLNRQGYTLGGHLARLSLPALLRVQSDLIFRRERGAQVDLQWETGPADYPFRFDTEILWRSLTRTQFAGREVPGLSPESLLLFLCVHGAKHMWSRLYWLGDVARLLRTQPAWPQALELATEAGCIRPLLLGLLLAHDLLEAPVPAGILERARAERMIQPPARQVVARLRRIPPAEPQGLEATAFSARMAERTWHKVRHYAAILKAPSEAELALFPLPEPLFFLYYPLRAVRLILKFSRRLHGRG